MSTLFDDIPFADVVLPEIMMISLDTCDVCDTRIPVSQTVCDECQELLNQIAL